MSRSPRLTEVQKKELSMLEPALRNCVRTADFETAKKLTHRIQDILRPTGHETRLLQAKNWLYECALESGQIEFAISGFIGTRQKVSANTRTYLEATALLSICYLRMQDFESARRLIHETISKINNIKTDFRRRQFHKRFLKRIEEESILAGLIQFKEEKLDVDKVQETAIRLIQTQSEQELLETLRKALPAKSISLLEQFRDHAVKRIPPPDRKYLPPPQVAFRDVEVGKTATSALKRVAWRSVCDPSSEVYQAWSGGLSIVYDKKYLTAAIIAALNSFKITVFMVAASIVAITIRFGVEVFCEKFAPDTVMISRTDRDS